LAVILRPGRRIQATAADGATELPVRLHESDETTLSTTSCDTVDLDRRRGDAKLGLKAAVDSPSISSWERAACRGPPLFSAHPETASFGPWRRSRLLSVLGVAGLRLWAPVGCGPCQEPKSTISGWPLFRFSACASVNGIFRPLAAFSPPVGPRRSRTTPVGARRLKNRSDGKSRSAGRPSTALC